MLNVVLLTILFSIATVVSILLLGSRAIVGAEMSVGRIIMLIFSWQFILGAVFAFAARLIFVVLNSTIYRIPSLSASSTSITTLITTMSLVFVVIANYVFLHERLTLQQMIGSAIIILGVLVISMKV
jgi:drug/metabolite transporter (DMT)-like permease